MAPEVFKHRKYDKKVDIFSFAMILYEMLEGDPPFSNYEPYEAAKYVAEGHRPVFRKGHTNELKEYVQAKQPLTLYHYHVNVVRFLLF
jgi:serine/threonine protein kinase